MTEEADLAKVEAEITKQFLELSRDGVEFVLAMRRRDTVGCRRNLVQINSSINAINKTTFPYLVAQES